ncbi:uncharacterized protein EMH_0059080 [Eimeria mitis]|uniref:Serine aminopeptidase S33 domain-containing protein n=1 Tax=Eimeria mitis TaxID=44415 RepID=U6KII5_9EIME|nr:uncharacterized protein EMH_0059080 [Eimeria mitis]CDJ36067.1 hypothetical protein EMH_0059080 [Eimeria mitis]
MSNIDKVRTLTVPTFFLCGRNDRSIPSRHTDRLFAACSAPIKVLHSAEYGGHLDSHEADDLYFDKLKNFIDAAKAESNRQLDAESRESLGMTLAERDQGGDKKSVEALKTHVNRAFLLVLLCTTVYTTLAISRHPRGKRHTTGVSSLPAGLAEATEQLVDYPHMEEQSSGALRNWEFVDDELPLHGHLNRAEPGELAELTEPAMLDKLHA